MIAMQSSASILPFPGSARALPSPRTPEAARHLIADVINRWMQGQPLAPHEQAVVETVLDTNYFGQLGRLAFGG